MTALRTSLTALCSLSVLSVLSVLGFLDFASSLPASPALPQPVDPLTCYISTDGPSVNPGSVSLTCGGGIEARVDLAQARPGYETSPELGDATVTRAAVGSSTSGSAIVRLWAETNDQTCVYYRDLASAPQDTDITCSR